MKELQQSPDESIDFCMTSPPYWGLRDYGTKGQFGLEEDFREYVSKLLEIFDELKRVLKGTGSFYLNLGDTYSRGGVIPAKCMIGIPWRAALGLIDRGWILRNDIVWNRPNSMPSSVKDRLSNTYEHIFHFVKSKKYYYNLDAIRVPHKFDSKPFNIRVRDAQKGRLQSKWGVLAHASEREVKAYNEKNYRPSKYPPHEPRHFQLQSMGIGHGGHTGKTVRHDHPLGKNPGDVWLEHWHFNRKYGLIETYFDVIVSPDQAYWFGFLWGDGNVDERRVRLTLQARDTPHVVKFREAIGTDTPLFYRPDSVSPSIGLELASVRLADGLRHAGFRRGLPQVAPSLVRHFIRGFFDAEGTVTSKDGEYELSITNKDKELLTWIGEEISEAIDADERNVVPDHECWRVRFGGTDQLRGIREYFYVGADTFLERKRDKFPEGEPRWSKRKAEDTDVWAINSKQHPFAHFAVYPEEVCVRPILSSCPEKVCVKCGMPQLPAGDSCKCRDGFRPGVVLDMFAGSGTTLVVAKKLGRDFIGIELNPEYVKIAKQRLAKAEPSMGLWTKLPSAKGRIPYS